jgi:hypothetical protein
MPPQCGRDEPGRHGTLNSPASSQDLHPHLHLVLLPLLWYENQQAPFQAIRKPAAAATAKNSQATERQGKGQGKLVNVVSCSVDDSTENTIWLFQLAHALNSISIGKCVISTPLKTSNSLFCPCSCAATIHSSQLKANMSAASQCTLAIPYWSDQCTLASVVDLIHLTHCQSKSTFPISN